MVSRLCLDRLGSAARRRETYIGQWLPEPIVRPLGAAAEPDPLDVVVQDEDARLGALVVLDTLTPPQRVAFVLHDVFSVPFDEVGEILGIGTDAARQHASRARRAMADAPEPTPNPEHEEAVQRFLAAMATGDIDAIVATLHPDVVVIGDANGTTGTAVNVIHGPDKFARFFLGLFARYGDAAMQSLEPVIVNGQLGLWTSGWDGDDARTSSPAARRRLHRPRRPGRGHLRHREPGEARRRQARAVSGSLTSHGTRQTSPEEKPWSVMPRAWLNRARWFSRAIWSVSSTTPAWP